MRILKLGVYPMRGTNTNIKKCYPEAINHNYYRISAHYSLSLMSWSSNNKIQENPIPLILIHIQSIQGIPHRSSLALPITIATVIQSINGTAYKNKTIGQIEMVNDR